MYKLFHIPESTFVKLSCCDIISKTQWKKWLKNNKVCFYTRSKTYGWMSNTTAKEFTIHPIKDIVLFNNREFDIVEVKDAETIQPDTSRNR